MKNKKHMSIKYSSPKNSLSFTQEKNQNSSFTSGVLKVAYHGTNRNGSYISKDSFEDAIPSIFNCPIVANYNREKDDFGGHDVDIIINDKNELEMINLTQPLGVVPESANYWWETVEEDGCIHEYLCVDVLLWTRQEGVAHILDNQIVNQSMEISVDDGDLRDGIYYIEKFEFTALCLLGEDVEPCFEGASIEVFSTQLKESFANMMTDYKSLLDEIGNSVQQAHSYELKGGVKKMDKKIKELFEKYSVNPDLIKFEVEGMSLEDIESKLKEYQLNSQVCEELRISLSDETFVETWGDYSYEVKRYSFFDFDAEISEAYYYDRKDHCNIYGFKYTCKEDKISVDKDSKKRKKCVLVDYDDGEVIPEVTFSIITDITSTFGEAFSDINKEKSELETYKTNKISEEKKAEIEEVFSRFVNLNGVEEFEALKSSDLSMEASEVEEKCFAILGKQNFSLKTPEVQQPQKKNFKVDKHITPVSKISSANDPYGDLFEKYGNI